MRLLATAAALLAGLAVTDAAVKQCFFAANEKALDSYVPCSNSGQHSSCCQAGDYCLADGACYGPGTKMTYIAGCTDPDYQDGTCKGGQGSCNKNTQFQGLALCGNNWVCCGGQGQTGVVPGDNYADTCPCDVGYATVIFNAGPSLAALNSLATNVPTDRVQPSSAAPTTSAGGDSSSSSRSRSSQTAAATTAAAPTSTIPISQDPSGGIKGTGSGSEPAAQTGSGNSSGGSAPDNTRLKVGLGVGIPVAAAVVGAIGVAVFCLRRKMLGGKSPRYVTQTDLSTPVWQGEVAGSGLPAAEAGAYNSTGFNGGGGGAWKQNGSPPMREQPTPPPQYKFGGGGGDESSLHRPESQGILQASRNF